MGPHVFIQAEGMGWHVEKHVIDLQPCAGGRIIGSQNLNDDSMVNLFFIR